MNLGVGVGFMGRVTFRGRGRCGFRVKIGFRGRVGLG